MTLDMTRGKPLPLLIRYALPLMLSALLQQCYTLADGIIVGRLLGEASFAAVGSAGQLHSFPVSMLFGLSIGFGVPLAQRFGAGDRPGFRRHLGSAAVLALIAGLLLTLVGTLCLPQLLAHVRTPPELTGHTTPYLRMLWLGLTVTAVLNLLTAALHAVGDSKTPFTALILSSVMNIVLDIVCILMLGMGVTGAALATVLAQAAAAAWCLRRLAGSRDLLPRRRDFRPDRKACRELLRLGIPQLLCHGVTAMGEVFVQAAINGFGVSFVTGMTAGRRYFSLLNVVGNGLEGALATFVGQNAGAREPARIRRGVRTTALTGIAASVVIAAAVLLLAEPLIGFLLPDGHPEAVAAGVASLRVEAVFLVFLYMLCEFRAAVQGMGNALVPMLSGFLELGMRLGAVALLPMQFGQQGLYFTDGAAWVAAAALVIAAYAVLIRKQQAAADAPAA